MCWIFPISLFTVMIRLLKLTFHFSIVSSTRLIFYLLIAQVACTTTVPTDLCECGVNASEELFSLINLFFFLSPTAFLK